VTNHADGVLADAELVLRSALAGDSTRVVTTVETLLDEGGYDSAYKVACYLAASTVGRLATGPWRLDFPDIEQASYDARWVARFLSAYANADPPMATALFSAALADRQLRPCLLTLAGSAVATLRRQRSS
jgi:hypothetical protein